MHFLNEKRQIEEASAKVVVAADGSASLLAKALGLSPQVKGRYALNARYYYKNVSGGPTDLCELYYFKGVCPGYFWIFPTDGSLFNVGIGMRLEDIQRDKVSLEEKMHDIISQKFAGRFANAKQVTEVKQWGVSVLDGKRKWSGDGFVLVGDAGTFAMTFSGEGVGPSMRSGKIAAKAIANSIKRGDYRIGGLKEFDKEMWKILEPEVSGFKWMEFLILHEAVFDRIAKKTAKSKELLEISSRMQNDYTLAKKLVSPATILKLLYT